jgi:hypothetical protein
MLCSGAQATELELSSERRDFSNLPQVMTSSQKIVIALLQESVADLANPVGFRPGADVLYIAPRFPSVRDVRRN